MKTVSQLLAETASFRATVKLAEGHSVKVNGRLPDTVTATEVARLIVDGNQKLDKAGRMQVKCPDAVVTNDEGRPCTTAPRTASDTPMNVAKLVYATVGQEMPKDFAAPPSRIGAALAAVAPAPIVPTPANGTKGK